MPITTVTILDVARVTIGDNCQLAPQCGDLHRRSSGPSGYPQFLCMNTGKEVAIGDNVWIGGNSVICPGVRVGWEQRGHRRRQRGHQGISLTGVLPPEIPCRVIRKITEADRRKLFRREEIDDEAWEDIAKKEMTPGSAL